MPTAQEQTTNGDSGDVTPVSVSASSEFDFEGAPRYSGETEPSDMDVTVIEVKQEEAPVRRGLGNKLVGQWVLESSAALCGVMVEPAEEEERTITSSMTATSPARKTIFQVNCTILTRS